MANPASLKPFTKNDIRINRNGRPRSFDKWRKLNQQILTELALDSNKQPITIQVVMLDKDGNQVIKEHYATVAEMIVRTWVRSEKRQQQSIEAAYGKVKEEVEHSGSVGFNFGKMTDADILRFVEEQFNRISGGSSGSGEAGVEGQSADSEDTDG